MLGIRSARALTLAVALVLGPAPAAAQTVDERAIDLALEALAAIERHWALSAYDSVDRLRAAVNLRGGAPVAIGITANIAVDRGQDRWRLDASGDIGPLTLIATPAATTLYVPGLRQFARRAGGISGPGSAVAGSARRELEIVRARLEDDYALLRYLGRETIAGAVTDRIEDTPAPGTTVNYWLDATTHLPRRIEIGRPGRRDARVDLAYAGGLRPVRVDAYIEGERDVQVQATLAYGADARLSRVQATTQVAEGGTFVTDVTFDWTPKLGQGFFSFTPPEGAREVPFQQLVSGLLFAAAGKLGALLPLFQSPR